VIRGLEQQPADVVVTALNLPPNGGSDLLAAMRLRAEWRGIPILALANSADQVRSRAAQPTDFQDCQVMFDHDAMLQSVARLASALASSEAAPVCLGEER
jgi:CheY-like chemotaxis protein